MSSTGRRQRTLRYGRSTLALLALVLLAACSNGDDTISDDTTPTTGEQSPTTTTEPADGGDPSDPSGSVDPEQEIVDRYLGYWDARFAANTGTPDPQDPELAEFATGAQLDAVVAETQANLDGGRAFRERSDPANHHEVTVVSVDGDIALVQACVVDDGLVIDLASGAVLDDAVATHNVRGELHRVDGRWRVASAQLVQRWEGVAGCALAS